MIRPRFEVADILKKHLQGYLRSNLLPAHHLRTLNALQKCRTAELGGHADECDSCGHQRISYNSCRNRHCPKCQGINREKWILKREADLLPIRYFHVVFTLPGELNGLCLVNPRLLYNLLFACSWQTMQVFGRDPKHLGAATGMVALLHTWGQNLSLHPHLHCIVPGGGLSKGGKWKPAKSKGKYLFPVKAMSKVFRGKFLEGLKRLYRDEELKFVGDITPLGNPKPFQALLDQLYAKNWVIYAKRPFGGPKQVIEYLGRYSHRVAISNHRLLSLTGGKVTFGYKDYRQEGKKKRMTLESKEFIRRFCMHILPPRFCKIRHYGLLSNRNKKGQLDLCRTALGIEAPEVAPEPGWKELLRMTLGIDVDQCPKCAAGRMHTSRLLPAPRAPP